MKEWFLKLKNRVGGKEMVLYLFFGGCTTLVNVAVYYLCSRIALISNVPSTVIAWFAAVLFAFVTNKIWVFQSKSKETNVWLKELASFLLCRVATGAVDLGIMWISVDRMHLNNLLFKIISNIIVIVLNYLVSKLFIFHQKTKVPPKD